ncbi:MAG: alpha/beta hydrolase [Pseudomonadota bacterium]
MPQAPSRILRIGETEDISLRIWDGDTDQVIFCVHGMADCSWIWAPLLDQWPGDRPTLIALDLPGHGESEPVARREMKSDAIAERLAGGLGAFSSTPMWLVGHSAGAKVAMGLARRGVVPVQGLTIIDTADDHAPNVRDRLFAHVAGMRKGAANVKGLVQLVTGSDPFADESLLDTYFRAAAKHDGEIWKVPVARGIEAVLATDIDMCSTLSDLPCPVQVIRGAKSTICTEEMADKFAKAATTALPVATIPNAGHGITIAQPAALAQALASVLPAVEPLRRLG